MKLLSVQYPSVDQRMLVVAIVFMTNIRGRNLMTHVHNAEETTMSNDRYETLNRGPIRCEQC